MEKIAAPLNIIANPIMDNQMPKIEHVQLVNNAPYENIRQEINQSEVVEHEIENYETIREMFFFMSLKKELFANLSKK